MTFKYGDAVVIAGSFLGAAKTGAKAFVTQDYNEGDRYVQITFDKNDPLVNGQNDGGYYPGDLVHAVKRKKAPKAKKPSQAYIANGKHTWEHVAGGFQTQTNRLRVPGGWLYTILRSYQPEQSLYADEMNTVFVPMPEVVKHKV